MLPEYGIVMSLVRATSAALHICVIRRATYFDQCKHDMTGETTASGDDGNTACDGETVSSKRLNINDIFDILCYVWYLPLFLAGPLMTCENFCRQVQLYFQFHYRWLISGRPVEIDR